ncbi:MAG: hypothetical protein GC172_14480 [Phycisphaera sp.]|nr:hypothetical protein [Phycisphaera sp.]
MTTKNTEQNPGGMRGFFVRLGGLDRRWIFLAMGLSIAVPILLKLRFPEVPGPMARATFEAIESLPNGSRVLLSFDFDPASKAELQPMANALVHHCASKGHKIVFMALWPLGKQMADQAIKEILLEYHGDKYEYGTDYVQLGFKAGNEGVIKVLTTNIAEAYPTDASGAAVSGLPLVADARDLGSFGLVSTISAGYPGAKEWVQYGRESMKPEARLTSGSTGVQASQLFPYYPAQLNGLLVAVKGAAEYETLVTEKYPVDRNSERLEQGRIRMGPQLVAHLLMIALIVLGNIAMIASRGSQGGAR